MKGWRNVIAYVVASLAVGLAIAVLVLMALDIAVPPTDAPSPAVTTPAVVNEELPPCPTEDSEGCYWDADTMGNGFGHDVVDYPRVIELPVPVTR